MFLVVLSPAKSLDFEKKLNCKKKSLPSFIPESKMLINYLLKMKKDEIGKLMGISQKLIDLNYDRYKSWSEDFNLTNSRHAISCFTGDVYKGLDVDSFSLEDLEYSQDHLRILSGLYGLLRPLDLMQPYRLEMGIKLQTNKGKNLYNESSAAGDFQFKMLTGDGNKEGSAFQTGLNRIENRYNKENITIPNWVKEAKEHNDPRKLTYEQQEELFLINLYEQKGSDALIKAMLNGDMEKAMQLYAKFHHTKMNVVNDKVIKQKFKKAYK